MTSSVEAFDLQPTLQGPRVTVRPVVPGDWQGMFAAAADPLLWEQHPASDRYQEPVFRQYFEDALALGSALTFEETSSGRIIGSSRYFGLDPDLSEIEIGWTFITRDFWGGSYNREVKSLMLDHAFQYVDTVVFWVGESNLRSRKAVEKIGGELRPGVQYRDLAGADPYVVYEITKHRQE